jgi:DNA-directed RNA polymerase specialized sigma24 family protein
MNTFPSTHWTQILAAGEQEHQDGIEALDRLLRIYQNPLKAHLIRKYRVAEDQADDCLQEFFAERILKRGILQQADASRGRFRTFLLTALDNFCLNEIRNGRTQKRTPIGGFTSLDGLADREHPGSFSHPIEPFETAWALQVMEETRVRMRQECAGSDRLDIWEVFAGRILDPLLEGAARIPYDTLVDQFGYHSPDQAANILITAKRMFLRTLRSVVAEYARDQPEIEEEICDLRRILSSARAWSGPEPGKET